MNKNIETLGAVYIYIYIYTHTGNSLNIGFEKVSCGNVGTRINFDEKNKYENDS